MAMPDPAESEPSLEQIQTGIAEASKHASNVLLAFASLCVFLLLAASADRETTLETEKARQALVNAETALNVTQGASANKERQLASSHADARILEARVLRLAGEAAKNMSTLRLAEQRFETEAARHSSAQEVLQIESDREAAERQQVDLEHRVEKLRQRPIYLRVLKPAREHRALAQAEVDDLLATEQLLSLVEADPRTQPDAKQLTAAFKLALLRRGDGTIDIGRLRLELSEVRARLPLALAQLSSALASFDNVIKLHSGLWSEVEAAEAAAAISASLLAKLTGDPRGREAPSRDATIEPLIVALAQARQAYEDAERVAASERRQLQVATETVARNTAESERSRARQTIASQTHTKAQARAQRAQEVESSSALILPLVNVSVKPSYFFPFAPMLLLSVFLYLRIYTGELSRRLDWLDRAADRSCVPRLQRELLLYPWLANFARYRHSIARPIAACAIDWMGPSALLLLSHIYSRSPAPSPYLLGLMLAITWTSAITSFATASRAGYWTTVNFVHVRDGEADGNRTVTSVNRGRTSLDEPSLRTNKYLAPLHYCDALFVSRSLVAFIRRILGKCSRELTTSDE